MDTDERLYDAQGVINYRDEFMILELEQDLADYYRALIPKWYRVSRQRYGAHISVVRNEVIPKPELWRQYEGEVVQIKYSNLVRQGKIYYWLNAFSTRLEQIRIELGLPVHSQYTLPPEGFTKCFHITLGNAKD